LFFILLSISSLFSIYFLLTYGYLIYESFFIFCAFISTIECFCPCVFALVGLYYWFWEKPSRLIFFSLRLMFKWEFLLFPVFIECRVKFKFLLSLYFLLLWLSLRLISISELDFNLSEYSLFSIFLLAIYESFSKL
jgi:hypothetical protein